MESWWGRQGLERMGRGAVGLLAAAWRTGTGPDAGKAVGDGRDGANGAKGTGGTGGEMPGGSGSDRVVTDTAPGSDPDGFTEDGLIQDGPAEDGLILDELAEDGLARDGLDPGIGWRHHPELVGGPR